MTGYDPTPHVPFWVMSLTAYFLGGTCGFLLGLGIGFLVGRAR